MLWQLIFGHFDIDDILLKIALITCFKIFVFPFWRRDPVLELQIVAICGAFVRHSFVFGNSVFADRIGMAG